jgi:hypothetical protein
MDLRDCMGVPEAAQALGFTPQRIRQMLAEDPPKLDGIKFGRDWLVSRASVDAAVEQRQPSEPIADEVDAYEAKGGVW